MREREREDRWKDDSDDGRGRGGFGHGFSWWVVSKLREDWAVGGAVEGNERVRWNRGWWVDNWPSGVQSVGKRSGEGWGVGLKNKKHREREREERKEGGSKKNKVSIHKEM